MIQPATADTILDKGFKNIQLHSFYFVTFVNPIATQGRGEYSENFRIAKKKFPKQNATFL